MGDRQQLEQQYWDSRAARELNAQEPWELALSQDSLSVADGNKLVWCIIHNQAFDAVSVSDVRIVCDIGCGWGFSSTILAKRGARVYGCDLSEQMLRHTAAMARTNGVPDRVHVALAAVDNLPYGGPFDAVFAGALLHHLQDLDRGMSEVKRVLRAGGRFVAYEPLSMPLWDFVRELLPYKEKQRSPGERALSRDGLRRLEEIFDRVDVQFFGPFLALERFLMTDHSAFVRRLVALDRGLARLWPALANRLAWYAVITCHKLD